MGFDSRGFELAPVADPPGYPALRRKRTGPVSFLTPEELTELAASEQPPRTRVFPWLMLTTATSRRTVSTQLISGPAILRKLKWGKATISTPPVKTLEIGWANQMILEAGVALATPRPYTNLIELQDPFAIGAAGLGSGFPGDNTSTSYPEYEFSLDLIIMESRFCFTMSLVNQSAQAEQHGGHVVVLEGVSKKALALFTGS